MTATHKNVYVALAAAQADMGPLIKGNVNPAFKAKYADLADLTAAVREPLTKHGLAFFHKMIVVAERDVMRTVLAHGESDTTIECDVPLIVDRQSMQGMKSATTYAKRIGLESVTGIAPEDDDGNAAAKAPPPRAIKAPPPSDDDADETVRRYMAGIRADIGRCMSADAVRALHNAEAEARKAMKLTKDEVNEIVEMCKARIHEIEAGAKAQAMIGA